LSKTKHDLSYTII